MPRRIRHRPSLTERVRRLHRAAVSRIPIAAFRAFEAWYEAERGEAFLQVYERYMPATPVVEF